MRLRFVTIGQNEMAAWETKSCTKKNAKGIYDCRFSSSNNTCKTIICKRDVTIPNYQECL